MRQEYVAEKDILNIRIDSDVIYCEVITMRTRTGRLGGSGRFEIYFLVPVYLIPCFLYSLFPSFLIASFNSEYGFRVLGASSFGQ